MAGSGDKKDSTAAPTWWDIIGDPETGYYDDEYSMKKAAHEMATEEKIPFGEALQKIQEIIKMWDNEEKDRHTSSENTKDQEKSGKDEDVTRKLSDDKETESPCPPGQHLNEFGRCVDDEPGISADAGSRGGDLCSAQWQPPGGALYNEGVYLDTNSLPDFAAYLPLIANPGNGNASNTFLKSMNQPVMIEELKSRDVDFVRLWTGRIWGPAKPTVATEATNLVPVLLTARDVNQGSASPTAGESFFCWQKDLGYFPETLSSTNYIPENNPANAKSFATLYEGADGAKSIAQRMKTIAQTAWLGGPAWLAPEGNTWGSHASVPPMNEMIPSRTTGIREKILIQSPPRSPSQTATLEEDRQLMVSLFNRIVEQNMAGGDNTTGGAFFDFASHYQSPRDKSTGILESFFPGWYDQLSVNGKSVYNYPAIAYENYIADANVPEKVLPDHNIDVMYKRFAPTHLQAIQGEGTSDVSGEKYLAIHDYVTLFSMMYDYSEPITGIPLIPLGAPYFNKWVENVTKLKDATGNTFDTIFGSRGQNYDDIIFPYESSIANGLDMLDEREGFPMRIELSFTLPKSLPGHGDLNQPTTQDDFPDTLAQILNTQAYSSKTEFPIDHALWSRYANWVDAVRYDETFLSYPHKISEIPSTENFPDAAMINYTYWKDFDSKNYNQVQPMYLIQPRDFTTAAGLISPAQEILEQNVDRKRRNSLNYFQFLENLMIHGPRLYGYDEKKQGSNEFVRRDHLSLVRSYDRTEETLLANIEGVYGPAIADTQTNDNHIAESVGRLTKNILGPATRTYSDILNGSLATSQTIGFRIKKYKIGADGNRSSDEPISSYYISSWQGQAGFNERFNFIDTRVKYGEKYSYDVEALHMVIGTKYKYVGFGEPTPGVPGILSDPTNDAIQLTDIHDGDGPAQQDFLDPDPSQAHRMSVIVDSFPYIKIIELPYGTINALVADFPPPPPEIEPVPYQYVDNKLLFLLRPAAGRIEAPPISILEGDAGIFQQNIDNQKYNNPLQGDDLIFEGDDNITNYQMFRLSTPPTSYESFANAEKILDISGIFSTSTGYEDKVTPNQKYYYIFRVVDQHGNISNPTPVYEIELVNESGTIYIVTKIYEFPKEEYVWTKPMKRFVSIEPAFGQRMINEDASGLLDPVAVVGGEVPGGEVPWTSALGKDQQIVLGAEDEALFAIAPNKKIKVRLTSKKTNRKLDLNLTFAIKHVETDVEPEFVPESFGVLSLEENNEQQNTVELEFTDEPTPGPEEEAPEETILPECVN